MKRGAQTIAWGLGAMLLAGLGMARGPVAEVRPRMRLGSLPFPGPLTLYAAADPDDLGRHHFAGSVRRTLGTDHGARGIVYTCGAGFLDLAHVRETVDWTWWLHGQTKQLIEGGGGVVVFEKDETRCEVVVRTLPCLDSLPAAERWEVLCEAAVRLAQRTAFVLQTWHEIGSWYGLRTVSFVPEDRSAFTWDDTTSHAVGVGIAARVLREGSADFDAGATLAIRAELDRLGAVPSNWTELAAERVKGRWWSGSSPLRRDLETGLETGFKMPWLVQGLGRCPGAVPIVLEVPSLRRVRGHDLSGMYEIRLTPSPSLAASVYAGQEVPATIDAERELPVLIERVRAEMKARFGGEVDRP